MNEKVRLSEETDHTVAKLMVLGYFVATLALLPMGEWARALISGAVVYPVVFLVARRFGPRIMSGMSVMIVGFATLAVLAMPTFPAMGGSGGRATLVGFIGVHAAAILWAVLWWRGPRQRSMHIPLVDSLSFGLQAAVGISGVAAIPVLLLLMTGDESLAILLVFPAYFVGFLTAAVCYWALQRIENMAAGRYLIGMLAGMCVYGAVGPVVTLFDHKPFIVSEQIIIAFLAGGFVGPAVALTTNGSLKKQLAKRSRRVLRVSDLQ